MLAQRVTPNLAGRVLIKRCVVQKSYVFMDFDGVTHPWGEAEDFRCLPLIESVLRDFPEAQVVIASDWRMLFSFAKLVARFSSDLRDRVAGTTPHVIPKRGSDLHGLREREAMLWLAQHEPEARQAHWCAIDDAPGNWLTRSQLVLTDFKRGFTDEDAVRLRQLLQSLRDGIENHTPPRTALRWA